MLHPIACCLAFLSVPGIGRKTLFDFRNQIAGIDSFRAAFSLLMDMQKKFPGRIRSLPDEGAFLGKARRHGYPFFFLYGSTFPGFFARFIGAFYFLFL